MPDHVKWEVLFLTWIMVHVGYWAAEAYLKPSCTSMIELFC